MLTAPTVGAAVSSAVSTMDSLVGSSILAVRATAVSSLSTIMIGKYLFFTGASPQRRNVDCNYRSNELPLPFAFWKPGSSMNWSVTSNDTRYRYHDLCHVDIIREMLRESCGTL